MNKITTTKIKRLSNKIFIVLEFLKFRLSEKEGCVLQNTGQCLKFISFKKVSSPEEAQM